jgi:hypothetical protein
MGVRVQKFGALSDFSTVGTGNPIDFRGGPQSNAIASTGTLAALTSTGVIMHATVLANTTYQFIVNSNQELVITPGGAVQIVGETANQVLTLGIIWRERVLEPSEFS